MTDPTDCPGPCTCHGPVKWCDFCGDVSLVCDDPGCMTHDRLHEKSARVDALREKLRYALRKHEDIAAELRIAEVDFLAHVAGNARMVDRHARR